MKIAWGAGAVADYPWHLDGTKKWDHLDTVCIFDLMKKLKENGIEFIDTANRYGQGLSEKYIGSSRIDGFLKRIKIITKIESCETVLRMGIPHGILIHNPSYERIAFISAWMKKIEFTSFKGVSTEPDKSILHACQDFGLNVIQIPYSKWDRRAEDEIFPYLWDGCTIMINRVLGGPEIGKSNKKVEEALSFIKSSRAKIDIVIIGTTNIKHLIECKEILI